MICHIANNTFIIFTARLLHRLEEIVYNACTMKQAIPNIVVASILSEPAGQRKFAGLFAYLGAEHRWNLRVLRDQDEITAFFSGRGTALQRIDGVIYSGRYDPSVFRTLASLKCPVVVMENESPELAKRKHNLAVIRNDADEIAKAAVKTFVEMGTFSTFAFVNDRRGHEWSGRRERAFRSAVKAKLSADVCVYGPSKLDADKDRRFLAEFLRSLDYPAAILAAHDIRAAEVIAAAKDAKISVPGKVSVLGIDNDPYVCDSISPGISSIEPDYHAEGKAAAELLDKMLHSRTPKGARHFFFGVKRVVLRESTPHLPPSRSLVSRAREFIERHATEGVTPNDVASHLGVSRALLDLRFRETQKTSVGKLITRTKLAEVARKLRETRLSITSIQETFGFRNANALKNLFKRHYNMSMRDYRAQRH